MTVEPDEHRADDAPESAGASVVAQGGANEHRGSGGATPFRGLIAIGAMAAGLALGVLLAGSFGIGSDIRAGNGFLVAGGTLAQDLANGMSGHGSVGPSFWSRDGEFCRVFSIRSGAAGGLSGIACRTSTDWRIEVVTVLNADGAVPAAVRSMMQDLMVGMPLTPAAEIQARRQGWRPA